ncbi:hypothetical protein HDU88_008324 [Geranomyces variabilis]|nr:hypothetical protein HDU88_008324 [Geranomyces variabilis]
MYTLSYQVLPADQQVALYLVNGQETNLGFAPVITFASNPNGGAQIYLDFNITGSRPPSSYALNTWHRDYARWDDSCRGIHVEEKDATQSNSTRIPESQPSPREHAAKPNTDNIDQQVASTDPQQQQVGKEHDATSLREQDVEPRAAGMDEMSRGAVRCVLSGAERGGAEMTNTGFNRHAADRIPESQPSLRGHAAIHSKPDTDDVDQQVAFTDLQQQRNGKDRDAPPLREQDIEPRAPGMDEIEVLGKAE